MIEIATSAIRRRQSALQPPTSVGRVVDRMPVLKTRTIVNNCGYNARKTREI